MIDSSDLKRGVLLDMDGAPWQVLDVAFQTPSARGASTYVKAKVRNLRTGQVLQKSWRGGEMLATADCEKRKVQFLYRDGDELVFMDEESYDQFAMTSAALGETAGYFTDGLSVRSMLYNGQVISIELPNTVELEITDTAPSIKGATAQAQMKPALLETGITVQVPAYISNGEKIRVDTRTGSFVGRASD
jgi:elongation factor P